VGSDQRWSDAARERRYALNITPDDPTQMFRLGMDLLQVGLTQEADAMFRRALKSARARPAYYGLGIAATASAMSAARDRLPLPGARAEPGWCVIADTRAASEMGP
jgi:tetratricopeptide (TPR) repeat protein